MTEIERLSPQVAYLAKSIAEIEGYKKNNEFIAFQNLYSDLQEKDRQMREIIKELQSYKYNEMLKFHKKQKKKIILCAPFTKLRFALFWHTKKVKTSGGYLSCKIPAESTISWNQYFRALKCINLRTKIMFCQLKE